MMLITRFSDHSLRMQIALVFGALVVGLSVLLSLGFGELLKHRIQRDAGTVSYTHLTLPTKRIV